MTCRTVPERAGISQHKQRTTTLLRSDFCIPGAPPDLDYADVGGNDFRVRPPDPHGFDREGDGLGCES